MQNGTIKQARQSAIAAVVALACAVVLSAIDASPARAAEPRTGTRTAQLSVSVSVVSACALATPAVVVVGDEATQAGAMALVGDAVSLSCIGGEAAVHIGAPTAESALYAQLAGSTADGAAALRDASEPVVVTVLF